MSSSTKSVTCPACSKVFGSSIEYQLHWSHSHSGRTLAPLIMFGPLGATESTVSKVESPTSKSTAQICSCPVCGHKISGDVYDRLQLKFSKYPGLFPAVEET
ncbi:MAG: hypothetical protein ABSD92_11395 [Candidatus Bathyarchaeia archaeon]